MSKDNKNLITVVEEFQHLMHKKNLTSAFALIDENATWHSDEIGAPWSGVHHGITQIKEHFKNISGTTTDFERTINEIFEYKNMVFEIGALSCVLNKTGQPFETDYICQYIIRNEKIISYRIFEDSLKLYKAYFDNNKTEKLGLKFNSSVATISNNEMAKVIKSADIEKHFPAPAPGAVNIFSDDSISVGIVQTENYPSYPHSNDYNEVHYVLKGDAKFRHGNSDIFSIDAGDIVYVKTPERHEWFDCSPDFKLIFVQSK